MNKIKTNIFIVNTPFQEKITRLIIKNYLLEEDNIILSTLRESNETVESKLTTIFIRRNIFAVFDFIKLKVLLKRLRKETNKSLSFFFPHLNNLFSSYFYNYALNEGNIKLNCYYEGIALFYDPTVKISRKQLIIRYFIAFLSGHKYRHHSKLFPELLRNNATAYTPLSYYTTPFKEIIQFEFDKEKSNKGNGLDKIVILGSPLRTLSDYESTYQQTKKIITDSGYSYSHIYFKPHFESKNKFLDLFFDELKSNNYNIHFLDKRKTIESICSDEKFSFIISLNRSSALINLKLIFPDLDVRVNCIYDPNNFLDPILDHLQIKFFEK